MTSTILSVNIEAYRTLPSPFDNYMVTEDGKVIRKEHYSVKKVRKNKEGIQNSFNKYFAQRELKTHQNKKTGYCQVSIRKTGFNERINWTKYVHDLVAEAFIGPRPKGFDVDHKDGNRSNNHVSNLEYVTRKENVRRAMVRKAAKEK